MKFATRIRQLSVKDLQAIMDHTSEFSVSDMDFLDTLAAHKCLIVTPWIMRANPEGGLARVAKLHYDHDGNIDKPRVLLEVAKEFRRAKKLGPPFGPQFGPRFSV